MISTAGIVSALCKLRVELQEDAGTDFPQGVLTELLVLYDVCTLLDLNIFQSQDVLGDNAWRYVHTYRNTPIGMPNDIPASDNYPQRASIVR